MIARLRGEHHAHGARWRPTPIQPLPPAAEPAELYDGEAFVEDPHAPVLERCASPAAVGWRALVVVCFLALRLARRVTRWLLVLALLSVAYVAIKWANHEWYGQPRTVSLPASPRAWLSAYEAASIDNPSEVCSQLLSPPLAASYAHQAHGSCERYFGRITSSSVTVRRVLEQGSTAVLELRQTLNRRDWSVVLDHRSNGWQAVDLIGS